MMIYFKTGNHPTFVNKTTFNSNIYLNLFITDLINLN